MNVSAKAILQKHNLVCYVYDITYDIVHSGEASPTFGHANPNKFFSVYFLFTFATAALLSASSSLSKGHIDRIRNQFLKKLILIMI